MLWLNTLFPPLQHQLRGGQMPAQFVDDGHGDQHGDDDCPGQPAGERIESRLHTSAGGSTEYKHTKKSSILVLPAPPAAPRFARRSL